MYKVKPLHHFGSKINAITLIYIAKLGFVTQKTSIGAQKVDNLELETHGIVLARFLFQNNLEKVQFFKEIFLLTNIKWF